MLNYFALLFGLDLMARVMFIGIINESDVKLVWNVEVFVSRLMVSMEVKKYGYIDGC